MTLMENETAETPNYPWWVRALAVLHVLSLVLTPALFFVFAVAAGVLLMVRHGKIDLDVIALGGIGIAFPALGAIFRGWFERWGRRNYSEPTRKE